MKEVLAKQPNKRKQSLLDFVGGSRDLKGQEVVFKGKNPKKFIQVISQSINNDNQVIIFCTEITKVKDIEER